MDNLINMTTDIKDKNQTNSDIEPYLKDIYEKYCLWKSLPSVFKFPPRDKKTGIAPSQKEFCEMIGVDSNEILELVEMKYQKDFAQKYGISEDTLSLWNKTIGVRDSLDDVRKWARGLTKNVVASLYNTAVRKGSSFEVKLFMQLVEGWEEKQKVEHDYKGVTTFTVTRPAKIIDVTLTEQNGNEDKLGLDGETVSSVGDTTQ